MTTTACTHALTASCAPPLYPSTPLAHWQLPQDTYGDVCTTSLPLLHWWPPQQCMHTCQLVLPSCKPACDLFAGHLVGSTGKLTVLWYFPLYWSFLSCLQLTTTAHMHARMAICAPPPTSLVMITIARTHICGGFRWFLICLRVSLSHLQGCLHMSICLVLSLGFRMTWSFVGSSVPLWGKSAWFCGIFGSYWSFSLHAHQPGHHPFTSLTLQTATARTTHTDWSPGPPPLTLTTITACMQACWPVCHHSTSLALTTTTACMQAHWQSTYVLPLYPSHVDDHCSTCTLHHHPLVPHCTHPPDNANVSVVSLISLSPPSHANHYPQPAQPLWLHDDLNYNYHHHCKWPSTSWSL